MKNVLCGTYCNTVSGNFIGEKIYEFLTIFQNETLHFEYTLNDA